MANSASKNYQLVNIWIGIFLKCKVLAIGVIIQKIDYGHKTFKKCELRLTPIFLWTTAFVKINNFIWRKLVFSMIKI